MKNIFCFAILLLISFSQVNAQWESGSVVMKIFQTSQDYMTDSGLLVDNVKGKYFTLNHKQVCMASTAWGWKFLKKDSAVGIERSWREKQKEYQKKNNIWTSGGVVVLTGTLCVYFDGAVDKDSHGNYRYTAYPNSYSFLVSIGLNGEIVYFKDIDKIVHDDADFLARAKKVKYHPGAAEPLEKFFDDIFEVINYYNEKHPSDVPNHNYIQSPPTW